MKAACFAVFLTTCLWGVSAGETHREEEDIIRLGLYVVYDDKFAKQAIFEENGTFNAYFTALTGAAEAYFKNHNHLTISLTLVNSSKLEDQSKLKYVTEGQETYLNASPTLWELEGIFTWNENLSRDVDVVFLVTGNKLKTRVSDMTGEWYGLAAPGSICYGNASVGIIYDDGITFNGAHLMAVQVALLLGAKKDNGRWGECDLSEEYLMSSINGGPHPIMSECSESSMWTFHGRVQRNKDLCWKDTPHGALEKKDSPVNFYGERKCDMCELRDGPKSKDFKCTGRKPKNLHGSCKAFCCSSGATRYRRRTCEDANPVNLPDGTPCGGGKKCVHGECF
uniref:Putative tick metalloprotease 41 n=1 Tax=Amblyomma cajennense TaxID=34607 RepID=A0A023FUM4_AMBCJ